VISSGNGGIVVAFWGIIVVWLEKREKRGLKWARIGECLWWGVKTISTYEDAPGADAPPLWRPGCDGVVLPARGELLK